PKVKRTHLWLIQAMSVIALFAIVYETLYFSSQTFNSFLVWLPFLNPIQALYRNPALFLLILAIVLLGIAPWLLDWIFRIFYGQQPLPTSTLATYSPETIRLLNQQTRQRKLPLPTLALLPTATPVALTYGWLPRNARIVVSQGALDRLSEDELATLYMQQLGHIIHCDFVGMTLMGLVQQLPYLVYWQAAEWGDRIQEWQSRSRRPRRWVIFLQQGLLGIVVGLSVIGYGLFRLWRWPALWFSRTRLFYADRFAVEVTGNPNGLTRALLKLAIGMAEEIQKQGQTSELLESWECLMPLGYRESVTMGSLRPEVPLASRLEWGRVNPYRHWLAINVPHPPSGDRLHRLAQYARSWQLDTELTWESKVASGGRSPQSPLARMRNNKRLWLQGAPFFGIGLGIIAGLGLWGLGAFAYVVDLWQITWFMGDRWLLVACLPFGFAIGTLVRINPLFPDLPRLASSPVSTPDLVPLLTNPTALPIDSPPVQWQGKLLGRKGVRNWLGQDLLLQTDQGLIKLHVTSPLLGPIGLLFHRSGVRPEMLVQRSVLVTGWWRSGVAPWIDVEEIQSQMGKTTYSNHPIGSILLACFAILWGLYLIWYRAGQYSW
ncbi:MAG: M48 family metalloprotease, partial [Leptolyngbyaceae cyanobacterium bins.59]|nr:M48 family metalloprotease [Leptolyngbyaceae cyanobacterium bins.59]